MAKFKVTGVTPVDRKMISLEGDVGIEFLRQNSLIAPVVLPHISTYFNSKMGDSIISYLNLMDETKVLKEGLNGADIKVHGSQKIMYRVARPPMLKYKIVQDTPLDADGTAGRGKRPFYLYLDRSIGVKTRIGFPIGSNIELITQGTPKEIRPNVWQHRVQMTGTDDSRAVPGAMLKRDVSVYRNGLFAGERSYEGPGIEGSYGDWNESYPMAGRMQMKMSGDAAYSNVSDQVFQLRLHDGSKDVTNEAKKYVLVSATDIAIMQHLERYKQHMLMYAQSTRFDTGEWMRDEGNNMEIIGGNGLYHQYDKSCRRIQGDWVGNAGWRQLERIMSDMDRLSDAPEDGSERTIYVHLGRERAAQVRELFRGTLEAQPVDAFLQTNAKERGLNVDFDFYKMDGVKLVFAKQKHSSPFLPYVRDAFGIPYSDYGATFFNLTKMKTASGMQNPIQLYTLGNGYGQGDRRFSKGTIASLANPQNGIISTSVDEIATHYYFQMGIYNLDPYKGMIKVEKGVDLRTARYD